MFDIVKKNIIYNNEYEKAIYSYFLHSFNCMYS